MELATDSELRSRWEATWEELRQLKKKKDDASGKRRDELKYEHDKICRDWMELVELKRAGKITDYARINAATKIIKEVAMLAGMPIDLQDESGRLDDDQTSIYWLITATHRGDLPEVEIGRWFKFCEKAAREMLAKSLLLPFDGPVSRYFYGSTERKWFFDGKDFTKIKHYISLANGSEGFSCTWAVNHWTWEGPYVKKSDIRGEINRLFFEGSDWTQPFVDDGEIP